MPPDTKAPAAKPADTTKPPAAVANAQKTPAKPRTPDKAAAYFHYSLAHIYEELVSIYGRSEFAQRAIQEYRLAIENDPTSEYLNAGLAELYAKTGRIRDAVLEAQDILKRDPNNIEAHKLLGRIYLRSLGDLQAGTQSQAVLKLAIEQFEQISRLEPANGDTFLLLGRLYRLNNEMLKAESAFKQAVKLDPQSEEAVVSLAYLYSEEGDSSRAIATLNSVPDKSGKIWAAMGVTYEQQKDYKKAIDAFKKAVEFDKDNLDAQRGLAQNLLNDGQSQPALEQYKQIAEADPQDAQTFLRLAEIYRRTGKFDLALDNLKKAEGLVQDSLDVPYNMAMVYEAQGRYDEAATTLQKLLDKTAKPEGTYSSGERNNRAVFLERLGSIYREQNKPQLAVDTFRKMLDLGDDNVSRGYQQLIETYRDAKQWEQATAAAREAVQKLPNDRGLRLVLDGQLADSGQADQAIADVKSQLKGTPEDREVYTALSTIYKRLRRWKESEDALDQAEKLSRTREEKDFALYMRGALYEQQKKYDAAEEVFKRILANDPQNGMILNYLGYMLADRGVRLEEALGYLKRALELDPQNGAYLDSIGWVYFKLGNYEMAEANLRRAADKIVNDGTVLDHLGDLYQKTGRLKLAAAHWERALQAWNKTVASEVDPADVARVQKKLDSAKTRLAQQGTGSVRKPQ
ncbi:MAG: tetratricopeptide repeat protein [Candidatus Koribacter versatilis]|uniref:Tetratricopeptide repeat protein n=1 Tax=Candidatus Korobacter versatilis TaxID=658062 RepID=A0A932A966_9BACT|nr:tetratricopeptide repeat protein [Candidatus Koribacter versatilis]